MVDAVWNRLEQLAMMSGGGVVTRMGSSSLVVAPDPGLPVASEGVPCRFDARMAEWLPQEALEVLMLRSSRAPAHTEHTLQLQDTQVVRAKTLRVNGVHIGMLVAAGSSATSTLCSEAVAQRLSDALALALLPAVIQELAKERAALAAQGLLQLELERVGTTHDAVFLLRGTTDERASPHFRGSIDVGCGVASYLGSVTGGPAPESMATLIAGGVRRWLADLPSPDPGTVIAAVHHDVLELLGHIGATVDLTVVVVEDDGQTRVATTGTAVGAFDKDGRLVRGVRATGHRLGPTVVDTCLSVAFRLPAGGYLVALEGTQDPSDVCRYIERASSDHVGSVSVLAHTLTDIVARERGHRPRGILVHGSGERMRR